MRILFADDNREICELYQLALGLQGIVTHIVHNGHEAVAAVTDEPKGFDVIVLDIEMSQLEGCEAFDGLQAFEAIRQLPEGKDVPIVMFTGYATPKHRLQAAKLGAAAFITKPAFPDDLVRVLSRIVEKRQQAQANKNSGAIRR